MTVLETGVWEVADIIEWMGIERSSFYAHSAYYYDILKQHCKFKKIDKNKILIQKVYVNVYNPQKYNRRVVRLGKFIEQVWCKSGIDTIENVYNKLFLKMDDCCWYKKKDIEKQIVQYLDWHYGDGLTNCGLRGNRYNVFCAKGQDGDFHFLSKEEEKVLNKLFVKYFGDDLLQRVVFFDYWREYKKDRDELFNQMFRYNDDTIDDLKEEFYQITGKMFEIGISLVKFEDEEDEEEIEEREIGGLNVGRVL